MLPELLTAWGSTAAWSIFEPVLKKLALDVVNDTAKNYVKKSFGSVLSPLNRKPLTEATGRAVKELLDLLEYELDVDEDTKYRCGQHWPAAGFRMVTLLSVVDR